MFLKRSDSNESIDFTSFRQLLYGKPNLFMNVRVTGIWFIVAPKAIANKSIQINLRNFLLVLNILGKPIMDDPNANSIVFSAIWIYWNYLKKIINLFIVEFKTFKTSTPPRISIFLYLFCSSGFADSKSAIKNQLSFKAD